MDISSPSASQTNRRPFRGDAEVVGADLASVLPKLQKPWFRQKHLLRLNFLLFFLILTPTSLGFDASMMNGLQTLNTWDKYFHNPRGAKLGFMNAVMPLGALLAALPAGYLADTFGRKRAVMAGLTVLILSAITQGCAQNIATFIVARFFVGIGVELTAVPSPVLISELAYPTHRAKATSMYQVFFYLGAIGSSWTTFGTFNIHGSTWSWRIPSLLQAFFPIIQLVGLLFLVPESPRWLIGRGRTVEARAILCKHHANGDDASPFLDYEMAEITTRIEAERASAGTGWKALLKTKADRKRMAIGIFTAIISNWSGNGVITYYLNIVLESVGITNSFTKTLINGILQIFNFFAAALGALLVDRAGRRTLWLVSCAGMLVMYIVLTALSAEFVKSQSSGVGTAVIVILFLYFFHYDIAVTPLTFGMAVVLFFNSSFNLINTFVNPIALDNMAWKYYIIYVVLLLIMLIVVYLFFAETKGHSLEEIADIFEGPSIVAGRYRKSCIVTSDVEIASVAGKRDDVVMVEDVSKSPKLSMAALES